MTLADEDNNSIPTDDVNRIITGIVGMQGAGGGARSINCWPHLQAMPNLQPMRHLVVEFATNTSGAIC